MKYQRLISMYLVCILIASIFPAISGSGGIPPVEASGFEPLFSGGSGTASDPYRISNVNELQWMGNASNLDKHFVLVNDINASATKIWNSGAGFVPVGTYANNFIGSLDGKGYNIMGLFINKIGTDYQGLFGRIGTGGVLKKVCLIDNDVTGRYYVGGLVGSNGGTVTNCSAIGDVSGTGNRVGGLVGYNYEGTLTSCSVTGNTSGRGLLGGLIGDNNGIVTNCFATGTVSGTDRVGGLVGNNYYGTVTNCFATGTTSGTNDIGGLVGENYGGTVTNCFATGTVSGTDKVGGLVGWNSRGTVTNSYATGDVSGQDWVGGLVGLNQWTVTNSYATGDVSGQEDVGGLVGNNIEGGSVTGSYATGHIIGLTNVGGLIGINTQSSVSNSYAKGSVTRLSGTDTHIGGFIGWNSGGRITNCYSTGSVMYFNSPNPTNKGFSGFVDGDYDMTGNFWDVQTSGQVTIQAGALGRDTEEMMNRSIFVNAGWDFTNIWAIVETVNYPVLRWQEQCPPTSNAGPDTIIDMGELVYFDGLGSYDDNKIVNYTWTFTDVDDVTLYGGSPTYRFYNAGIFVVTLKVINEKGNWNWDFNIVTVIDTQAPVSFAGSDRTISSGDRIIFNGLGSRDNVGIVNYTWSFFDLEEINLYGMVTEYKFDNVGEFVVTLNVTDAEGNWDTDIMNVTVLDTDFPVVNAGSDRVIDEGTLLEFDGSGSYDNVGIVNYSWTFTDDGPVTLYGMKPKYLFKNAGSFIITLNVSDAAGNWHTDTMTVIVKDTTSPVSNAGSDIVVEVGTTVIFNGSGSYDNVGIVNYTWTFTYGNNYITLYGIEPQFKFYLLGIFNVNLYITDAMGLWNDDEMIVTVRDTTLPHADAGSDQTINQGDLLLFDARGSSDNYRIANYTWTFMDGSENVILYGISPQYRFLIAGIYNVTLTVTDTVGLTDTDHVSIIVNALEDPMFSVHGRLLDGNGDPIEGALVEITASDGNRYTTTTGPDGSFSIDVPKGSFTWKISKEGYEELSGESSTGDLGENIIKLKEIPTDPDEKGIDIIFILIPLIVFILIIVGIAIFLFTRRKKGEPSEEGKEKMEDPPVEDKEADPSPEGSIPPEDPLSGGSPPEGSSQEDGGEMEQDPIEENGEEPVPEEEDPLSILDDMVNAQAQDGDLGI